MGRLVMSDIIIVTVSGECFRDAVQRRIAVLEVEAEEERIAIEERTRQREEHYEKLQTEREQTYTEQVRKHDEWERLPWWKRRRELEPFIPTDPVLHRLIPHNVLSINQSQVRLKEVKTLLPCPNGPMQISLSLAQELGLVT
jgi:hypothetical protein